MSEETVDWTLWRQIVSHSGVVTIESPDGTAVAQSISLGTDGVEVFDSDRKAIGEWATLRVARRATMCYDNEAFTSRTAKGSQARKQYSPPGNIFPEYAIVGYSRTAEGPVMAKCPRKGTSPNNNLGSAGNQRLRDQNSFKGNEFRIVRKVKIRAEAIIPHISLTVPINLINLKQSLWTAGASISTTPVGQGYNGDSEELAQLIEQQADILFSGESMSPIAMYSPIPRIYSETHSEALFNPYQPPSESNPAISSLVPTGEILLQDRADTPGFHLHLHLVLLKDYAEELVEILKRFAFLQSKDHLTLPHILQACEIYHDIRSSPNLQLESVFKQGGSITYPVPECPLNVFIVYFQHWIRYTEFHGLSDYIHPFRFAVTMFNTDMQRPTEGQYVFSITELDYEHIQQLLLNTTPKLPSIPLNYKIRVFPFMMPGTRMSDVYLDRNHLFQVPHEILLALTGIGNVYCLGIPSYACGNSCYDMAIPMPILDETFSGRKPLTAIVDLSETAFTDLCSTKLNTTHAKFIGASTAVYDSIHLGPVWKANSVASPAAVQSAINEQGDPETAKSGTLSKDEYGYLINWLKVPEQHYVLNAVANQLLASYPADTEPPVHGVVDILTKGIEIVQQDRTRLEVLRDLNAYAQDKRLHMWLPQTVCRIYGLNLVDGDNNFHEGLQSIDKDAAKFTLIVTSVQLLIFAGEYKVDGSDEERDDISGYINDLLDIVTPVSKVEKYLKTLSRYIRSN
ncbi:hypothetical protein ACHAQJ_006324 [Trichoderma viride]